ncbi:MAG TPA: universal stress protein [Candidatus Cybelea sp.]|nr:universal stress protein [Candidatus Cybelea sp.]
MPIRKIVVPLAGIDEDAATLETALALGRRLQAHVEAFHAVVDPRDAVAFVGEGMTSTMIEQIMKAADKEGHQRNARARELFDRLVGQYGVTRADRPASAGFSVAFVERVGREDDLVAERSRLADLIVAHKPPAASDSEPSLALEAALRETGRPVLVIPRTITEAIGRTIAIAWNGSIEVSRALRFAMPFLKQAEKVVVLSVREEAHYGPPAEDAVDYLAWHGITSAAANLPGGARTQGQTLLAAAADNGADMMVQGAYTRSRMRRLIFGGVTAEVLAQTTIPVLMTH